MRKTLLLILLLATKISFGQCDAKDKEIVVKDDIIRDFLTLDRVQKINDKRFALEISYAKGPL